MYSKKLIKCIHCGTEKQQSRHSATGKYCSNKCQVDFQYAEFVKRWLTGKESGTVGRKGISLHVRRYVFEKYEKYQELAKRQSHISKTKFSFEEMKNLLNTYLDIIPKPIEVKLPTLKKIQLPQLKK